MTVVNYNVFHWILKETDTFLFFIIHIFLMATIFFRLLAELYRVELGTIDGNQTGLLSTASLWENPCVHLWLSSAALLTAISRRRRVLFSSYTSNCWIYVCDVHTVAEHRKGGRMCVCGGCVCVCVCVCARARFCVCMCVVKCCYLYFSIIQTSYINIKHLYLFIYSTMSETLFSSIKTGRILHLIKVLSRESI